MRVVPEEELVLHATAGRASSLAPAPLAGGGTGKAVLAQQPQQQQAPGQQLPAAACMGIRLSALLPLIDAMLHAVAEARGVGKDEVTTKQVVELWVKPLTARHGKVRMAQLRGAAAGLVDGDTGVPHYFISHAWNLPLDLLRRTVQRFLADSNADSTYVWVDCLAVNQHLDRPENARDVGSFKDVLAAARAGTIVVLDAMGAPATRAWCIYEVRGMRAGLFAVRQVLAGGSSP